MIVRTITNVKINIKGNIVSEITQSRLKELLNYDKDSGDFTWNIVWPGVKVGEIAGSIKDTRGKKYLRISLDRKSYYAHRLAYLFVEGTFPKEEIDHIDGDGLNNCWVNLREVSSLENKRNSRLPKTNTSGVLGVSWSKNANKWRVSIKVDRKSIHLGYFNSLDSAAKARKDAEVLYNFHPNHGNAKSLN